MIALSQVLGLPSTASLQELSDAGRTFCATHWTSLQAQFSGHSQVTVTSAFQHRPLLVIVPPPRSKQSASLCEEQ
jgi:hypothetical protein